MKPYKFCVSPTCKNQCFITQFYFLNFYYLYALFISFCFKVIYCETNQKKQKKICFVICTSQDFTVCLCFTQHIQRSDMPAHQPSSLGPHVTLLKLTLPGTLLVKIEHILVQILEDYSYALKCHFLPCHLCCFHLLKSVIWFLPHTSAGSILTWNAMETLTLEKRKRQNVLAAYIFQSNSLAMQSLFQTLCWGKFHSPSINLSLGPQLCKYALLW